VDKVALVLLEPRVSKALKELQEALEQLALALKVRRDLQEPRELLVYKVQQGPLERLALLDSQARLEPQEQQAHKELLG
jgi:signal recognition particle subunit SEC65